MNSFQSITDKTAISLSLACTIHCLVLPLIAVFLPSFIAIPLQDEAFHMWMIIGVVPVSAYALTMGCKKHKRYKILLVGSIGLLILSVVAFLGHELLGEDLEKTFTVIGAIIIAVAHIWNYRLCQHQNMCACPE
jgi:FtsH-binding integral membrane protein